MTQKDFPRGGKKPAITPASKSLLFEKNNPIKARKERAKKSSKKNREDDSLVASSAQLLTYSNLCEGMVILGRVHEITDYDLIISLPGRLSGRINATDVSESYTNLLQSVLNSEGQYLSEFEPISELYSPGDSVVTYIKALGEHERWRISLSLEPHLVNQNVSADSLTKGSKIVSSVSSIEDHGYVMETGIPNVRAFLSKKDVDDESKYLPGKQIMCAVKNVKRVDNTWTISLSTKEKHLQTMQEEIRSLDSLLPGIQLTLGVKKSLSNGLQVTFANDKIGYINQIHLPKTKSHYNPGLEVDGTLLYIIPTLKFAYFTLLKQIPEKTQLNKGDIVDGRVICQESNGIFMKLGKGLRGFVPFRRTDVAFAKMSQVFVPESEHKCRVLAYDCMDRVHICSTEKAILKEKHLSKDSFVHGELVDATITDINKESGFVTVSVGKTIGSIAPDHTGDTGELSTNLKVGQVVKARVLSSSPKSVKFTLKPLLLNSDLPILDDINKAQVGSIHHGTIRQITQKGMLVKFFGELAGWVPKSFLDPRFVKRNWNHFVGEAVTVEIKAVNLDLNRLTLKIMKEKMKKVSFKVGEAVNGVVVDSSVEGIQLKVTKNESEIIGFLPAGHIAPCSELGSLIATRSIPGDEIAALVFSTFPSLLFSVSFVPQKNSPADLKIGSTILCSMGELGSDRKLILPIDNLFGNIKMKEDVLNLDSIRPHQILLGTVIRKNASNKEVILSPRFTELSAVESFVSAIDTLGIYLMKVKDLSEKSYYQKRPISAVKLGQKVQGVVEKITEHGLVLKLEDNLQATVRKDHYKGDVKVGDKVKGVVLWVNFIYELLEVSLLPQLVSTISPKFNNAGVLPLQTKVRGTVILITNWFVLVLVQGEHHGRFVVLPARLHLNDLNPDLSSYSIGQKVRCFVVLNEIEFNSLSICLPKSALEEREHKQSKSLYNEFLLARKIGNMSGGKMKREKKVGDFEARNDVKEGVENQDFERKEDKQLRDNEKKLKDLKKQREVIEKKEIKKKMKEIEEMLKTMKKKQESVKSRNEMDETKKRKIGEENEQAAKKLKKENKSVGNKNKSKNEEESRMEEEEEEKEEEEIEEEEGMKIEEETTDEGEMEIEDDKSNPEAIPECGFYWDTVPSALIQKEESSSESEDEDEPKQKKKKKLSAAERREQERQKEREIREREEALASVDHMPKSVDQFDRLVLGSPDSSLIWLQYMAYHLQATEVEKARSVAKRAVKTINFREEEERLNVWQAWLNLEAKFGNAESLNEVFQEAVKVNDAAKIYSHMLTTYSDAGKQIDMEKTVNLIVKKFKDQPEMWIKCGACLLKAGLKEKSRYIMQRALQSLPPHEHVNLIVRFAHLENNHGDKERSQTLFEQILNTYPKRTDVWSSYVDSLIKSGDIEIARKVMERSVTSQILPARKMKVLFKKFINFEEQYGTQETVQNVRELANEYVKEHTR